MSDEVLAPLKGCCCQNEICQNNHRFPGDSGLAAPGVLNLYEELI